MQQLEFNEWLASVESCISDAITACSPRSWNEDHISYSWLSRLTSSARLLSVRDRRVRINVAWDAFKADGRLEEDHGDVAFLVRVTFSRGRSLLGVGFLEAKRSYPQGDFQALDWDQLEHQATQTAHHHLLLYSQSPTTAAAENVLDLGFCRQCFPSLFQNVVATVLPSDHALAVRSRKPDLASFGLPLSYQVCCRYLRGFDLDYDTVLTKAVQRGVVGGIKYLFVAHAALDGETIPSLEAIEFNRERYHRLDRDERGPERSTE